MKTKSIKSTELTNVSTVALATVSHSETAYKAAIDSTKQAICNDIATGNKWADAGHAVCAYYKTEVALNEVKAQFCQDAILPAIDQRHAVALAETLPRKGSKEYDAYIKAHSVAAWDKVNNAKIAARATVNTYFTRLLSYAFPKDKAEPKVRDLKTRLNEELAALVKACQSAESAPFDLLAVISCLNATLQVVNK